MSKSSDRGLWDLAVNKANETKDQAQTAEDSAVCFIGSKNAGKTSIILRYLDRDEQPKPTVALEYTFGRRAKGHNIAKDVGHIWELGGGTWLSKLLDIPINPDTIMHTALVLVLDLSTPNELWFTLETLLKSAKSRIENVIAEVKQKDPNIRDKLKKRAWERIGEEHPDKSMIDPFLIPLTILGGKYDVFQDFDSEKRKVICKTLRFVAHTHGANLQYQDGRHREENSSTDQPSSIPDKSKTEHGKPMSAPAGLDSFQQIGSPPVSEDEIGRVHARTPMDLWEKAFTGHFPQENTNNPAMVEDPAKDPQFIEPAVDTLRSQKDEELERYRRLAERRAREVNMY